MLRSDRKQQNSIKQLSFNKIFKIKLEILYKEKRAGWNFILIFQIIIFKLILFKILIALLFLF